MFLFLCLKVSKLMLFYSLFSEKTYINFLFFPDALFNLLEPLDGLITSQKLHSLVKVTIILF